MKKKEKAEKKAQENYQREVRKAREEKRQEEEQRKREEEEERLRQEEEEYKKWEQFIVLEGEGIGAKEDLLSNPERVESFIAYLKKQKVCVIDEVAAEFDMKNDVCSMGRGER